MPYYQSFFFQAEDGIRDYKVTGVQTCALPISERLRGDLGVVRELEQGLDAVEVRVLGLQHQIGRAACRERREMGGGAGSSKRRGESGGGTRGRRSRTKADMRVSSRAWSGQRRR